MICPRRLIFLVSLVSVVPFALAKGLQSHQVAIFDQPVEAQTIWSYGKCGSDSDILKLESLSIEPDPPVIGQDLEVQSSFTLESGIEDGAYVNVVIQLGLIKLLQTRVPICDQMETHCFRDQQTEACVQCPLKKGSYTLVSCMPLSKAIPKGKFQIQLAGYTGDDEDISCVQGSVDFTR